MKYPSDFVNEDHGWQRIHAGHDLDRGMLLADLADNGGSQRTDGQELVVEEVWLSAASRIKWCVRHDWSCDSEGDWHAHWFAARPGFGKPFTLVYWGCPELVSQ